MPAHRVSEPGEITADLLGELMQSGPALLDIRHDAAVRIEGAGRVEALQQMSSNALDDLSRRTGG